MGRGDSPWEPPPYLDWLLGVADCFPWPWWFGAGQCDWGRPDLALIVLLIAILALLIAKAFGWVALGPREIVLYVVCLGLVPAYLLVSWTPKLGLTAPLLFFIVYGFPTVILFFYGIHRLWRRPAKPASWLTLAIVILFAFKGHGCLHYASWTGIH